MNGVRDCLSKLGYSTVPASAYQMISYWDSWYKGRVGSFHNYMQYNGVKRVKMERMSLGMAKKICEDKADLLLNEKINFNISDNKTKAFIMETLDRNNFWVAGNQLVELSNALGCGAFVEFFRNGRVEIDTVEAGSIFPLSWDNGEVSECAFASRFSKNGEEYIYLNIHVIEDGEYVIKNRAFRLDRGGELALAQEVCEAAGEVYTGCDNPFFQIIKPNIVNNADRNLPLGVSVFANAIDILKGIDIIYDSFINEFSLGKKRIFVDPSILQVAVSVDKDNTKLVPTFDTNDVAFYGLQGLQEKELIKEINMELRIEEHINAINNNLNILSDKCGFGRNYYSFSNERVKTATEVISENSALFRRIKRDEIIIGKALIDMVKAVIHLANRFCGAGLCESQDITIDFDDSIIEDKASLRNLALVERNAGLIDDVEYFVQTRSMSPEQAGEFIKEIKSRACELVADNIEISKNEELII